LGGRYNPSSILEVRATTVLLTKIFGKAGIIPPFKFASPTGSKVWPRSFLELEKIRRSPLGREVAAAKAERVEHQWIE
jgi:hypothetical protein